MGVEVHNEKESSDKYGLLMYSMKGGLPCIIRYVHNDEVREVRGNIEGMGRNTIRINRIQGNEELQIDKNQILEIEVATQLR